MKAVLRVYWTFFTAFPIQRWLGVAGLIVLAIGSFVALVGLLNGSEEVVGLALGLIGFLVLVVVPTAFAAGGTLRALSVPSTHALLPRFRVRVLLAVALFVGSIGLPWYGLAIAFGREGIEVAAVYAVGALTAVVLSVFVITAQPNWLWLGLPIFVAGSSWLDMNGPQRLAAAGFSLPWIVGIASALAWIAFAIWYLRARRIRPVLLITDTHGLTEVWRRKAGWQQKRWPADLTRGSAMAILLWSGRVQPPLPRQLLNAVMVGAVICLALPFLQFLPSQNPKTPPFTAFVWPFYATMFTLFGAHFIVGQSRRAWLRVPGARVQVFRVVERHMARLYLRIVTCITALVLTSVWVFDTSPIEAAWGIALMASAALYSACLALASVRTVWPIAFGLLVMLVLQVLVLGVERQQAATQLVGALLGIEVAAQQLGGLLVVQLAAAGVCRAVAEFRWRSIDWLRFRPMRIGRNAIHGGTRA
jgi:hypothetical protein